MIRHPRSSRSHAPDRKRRASGIGAAFALIALLATMIFPTPAEALELSEFNGSTVYLVNAGTGRYLDADGDGAVRQSLVPNEDDQWVMSELFGGTYNLVNVEQQRYLDADGSDRNYDVNLSSNNRDADTQWQLEDQGDGTYTLRSGEYGLWLDGDFGDKDYNVDLTQNVTDRDASWYIVKANVAPEDLDGAVVLIANAETGRFLDADADGGVNQSETPEFDDRWLIEDVGGQFTIRNTENDRLLHGANGEVDLLGQGGANTRWTITLRQDNVFEIGNVGAGMGLDGDRADSGFNVDLTANTGDVDAHWNILVLDSDLGCVTEALTSIDQALLCVNGDDMFEHLAAFQSFADQNGGTRASGTPGYNASADYVAALMQNAGLIVTRQVFDFSLYTENSVSLTSDGAVVETTTMSYSGAGVVAGGTIVPVDLALGLDNESTSGCEPEDFLAVDLTGPSDIALIQRGACAFGLKVTNAQAAGAEAVVIFNQGNTEDRKAIIGATLGAGVVGVVTIPALDVAYDDGVALIDAVSVDLAADTTIVTNSTENIIADLPGNNPGNVVMAGSHLDSVAAGPGIQDNGSGSAALVAVALMLADNQTYVPQNGVRFAWWGAEESGLIGSNEYIFNPVFGISDADYAALAGYLNFDMIASPNYVFGVYDADQSTFVAPAPVPDGSAALEDLFEAYYSIEDVPYDDTAFSGRSDYQAFINVGIPAAGLFTGAEEIKTPQQVSIWGGVAGDQFDPCYHLACDTIDNVSFEAAETNVDAITYAMFNLAASTAAINGVPGIDVEGTTPDEVVFDGPQGTFVGEGGFAPHNDNGLTE